jgi:MFS family permease
METDKVVTKDGMLLLVSIFLNTIPIGYMNVVPLIYLTEIGYNPSVLGTIYAISALSNTIGLIPMGVLADRYGRKWFLIVGSLMPCVSYVIFGLTLAPAWLEVASAIGGIGFAGGLAYALVNPAIIPLLASSTSDAKRTTMFGLGQGTFTLGLSVGGLLSIIPTLLTWLFRENSSLAHSNSYLLMSGVVVASVVPLLFFSEERRPAPRPRTSARIGAASKKQSSKFSRSSWIITAKFSVIFALTGLGLGLVVQLLPTWYALRFGVSEDTVGIWTAVANAASLAIVPIIPGLVKRAGTLASIVSVGLISTIFLVLMPVSGSFETAASLFVIRTLLEAMSWAILLSYTMSAIPEKERATATGLSLTSWGIGATIGTYVGGYYLGVGMLALPFLMGSASYALAFSILYVFFRRYKPPEELRVIRLPNPATTDK